MIQAIKKCKSTRLDGNALHFCLNPLVGIIFTVLLIIFCINQSVNAALSATTAKTIQGSAPTATISGNVTVLWPDGITVLTNGMTLWGSHVPNQFSVLSTSINSLTFTINDLDGDTADNVTFGTPVLNWTDSSGTPLNSIVMSNWLTSFYSGQQLKISVTIPYTPKTLFGDPNIGITKMANVGNYTVNVPPHLPPAGIHSQGYIFAGNSGYPQTGFQGATYQIQADPVSLSNNTNFTWLSTDPTYAHIDNTGVVWLDGTDHFPTAPIQIYAVPTGAGPTYVQTFRTYRWFAHLGGPATWDQSNAHCQSQGYRLPHFYELSNGPLINAVPASRAEGPLWSEWGGAVTWNNSWWWTADINAAQTAQRGGNVGYYVKLTDGSYSDSAIYHGITSDPPNGYVVCVLDL